LKRPLEPPAADRLSAIKAPTQVFVGSRDIPEMQEIAELLASGVTGAVRHTVDGAGHMVNMERPEEFLDLLEAFLKLPGQVGESTPPDEPAPAVEDDHDALTDAEKEVLRATNAERAKLKLPPYRVAQPLMKAARAHAANMVKQNKLSHTLDDETFVQRIEKVNYGFLAAGENIAQGQPTGTEAVSDWMTSPGHKANILSKEYSEIGIGQGVSRNGETYWVQVFARPRSTNAPHPR
jgi:uncharacterized protein YkwD